MDASTNERREKTISPLEKWLEWVGAFLFFGMWAGVIVACLLDIGLESPLLWAGGVFGFLAGYPLFLSRVPLLATLAPRSSGPALRSCRSNSNTRP